jgi:chromosome segregation ATPase
MDLDIAAASPEIASQIEELRLQYPDTQDLYREVCALIFFRYGITPTANKLYHLVRKGSMSAPAKALATFWNDLREKSRVRIEHPDLPAELRVAAGELTAALWGRAQAAAQQQYEAQRTEAQADVLAATAARDAAEAREVETAGRLRATQLQLTDVEAQRQALEQQFAAEKATRAALATQLEQAHGEQARLQEAIETARRDFAKQLDAIRADAALAEERLRASEERALREIDRERQAAAKLKKELESVREASAHAEMHHQADVRRLQETVGDLRQQLGTLDGRLQQTESAKAELNAALEAHRVQLAEKLAELAATHRDLQQAQTRIGDLDQAVAALREDLGGRDARLAKQASQIDAFQRLVIRTRQRAPNSRPPGASDRSETDAN